MTREPKFSPTTERSFRQLPEVLRDADSEQLLPLETKEVLEQFNLIRNASAEASRPGSEVGRNYMIDPSFEYKNDQKVEVLHNHVKNPIGALLDGTVKVRTNLTYRSNVVAGPNGIITPGVMYKGAQWNRLSSGMGTALPSVHFRAQLNDLVAGETYTASVEVVNIGTAPIDVMMRWCNSEDVVKTVAPGQQVIVSGTGSEILYFSDRRQGTLTLADDSQDILFRKPLVEAAGIYLPYFDGSTGVGDTDLTPVWEGTVGDSPSHLTAPAPKGWIGENCVVYWSARRKKTVMFVPFVGEATAKAVAELVPNAPAPFDIYPSTAIVRSSADNKESWRANMDGAWPRGKFKKLTDQETSDLQYPVLSGGVTPPQWTHAVGMYWVDANNIVYRRTK